MSTGQDLLALLMGGGSGSGTPTPAATTPSINAQQQQSQPVTPRREQSTPSNNQSGQDILAALFNAARTSAPTSASPNANLSPSAVNHAARQRQEQQQQQQDNVRQQQQQTSSPPPMDLSEGSNLLLSMLNIPVKSVASSPSIVPATSIPSEKEAVVVEQEDQEDEAVVEGDAEATEAVSKPLAEPEQEEEQVHEQEPAEEQHDAPEEEANVHEIIINLDAPNSSNNTINESSLERLPISRFSSPSHYTSGHQIAMNGLIAYSTRAGRIRVIDPQSGSRLIRKAHTGLADDMDISNEVAIVGSDSPADNTTRHVRRLASCFKNKISIWEIPASFESDDAPQRVILEIQLQPSSTSSSSLPSIKQVKFNKVHPELLLFHIAGSSKPCLINLAKQSEPTIICTSTEASERFGIGNSEDPIATANFSEDGDVVVYIAESGLLSFYTISTTEIFQSQLKTQRENGPPDQVEIFSLKPSSSNSVLLVTWKKGTIVELYDIVDLSGPVSRLVISQDNQNNDVPSTNFFSRVAVIPGQASIALSTSTKDTIYIAQISVNANDSSTNQNASSTPAPHIHFSTVKEIPIPHHALQLVVSELHGYTSIFYLHTEGFEQLSLPPHEVHVDVVDHEPLTMAPEVTVPAEEKPQEAVPEDKLEQDTFLQSFDQAVNSTTEKPAASALSPKLSHQVNGKVSQHTPSLPSESAQQKAEYSPWLDNGPSEVEPRGTSPEWPPRAYESAQNALSHSSMDLTSLLRQTLQQQQDEQERRHAQLLQTVSSIAQTVGQTEENTSHRIAKAIRSEIREELLPVIASALSEIGQQPSPSLPASTSRDTDDTHALAEHIAQAVSSKLDSFTNKLHDDVSSAVTTAMSTTMAAAVERIVHRLSLQQSEQTQMLDQMRHVILTEQTKREESTKSLEAELVTVRDEMRQMHQDSQAMWAQNTQLLKSLAAGRSDITGKESMPASAGPSKSTHSPASHQASFSNGGTHPRPLTPVGDYEDMFLHALKNESDPLVKLIDTAPPERMDRVLPYDGQPAITAPGFLALCLRLAQDFDNSKPTFAEDNGQTRLAWIFSCLRSAKWARGNPQAAPFLPRVFTQVMHSLNSRRQHLVQQNEAESITRVLHKADEFAMFH